MFRHDMFALFLTHTEIKVSRKAMTRKYKLNQLSVFNAQKLFVSHYVKAFSTSTHNKRRHFVSVIIAYLFIY